PDYYKRGGVTVYTDSPCAWRAQSNVPWVTDITPASGAGKSVITYQIDDNTTPFARTGILTIGGQNLTIRQSPGLTSVSAASFKASLAPGSIATIFGAGLAKTTQAATTVPLPSNLAGTTVTVRGFCHTSR